MKKQSVSKNKKMEAQILFKQIVSVIKLYIIKSLLQSLDMHNTLESLEYYWRSNFFHKIP